MRTRVLVMVLGAMLAACAGEPGQSVPQTVEASPTPESTPFAAHLGEYLDPAWTNPPLEGLARCGRSEDGDLEGYINGRLIIVSADTGQLLVPPDELAYADPWPSSWKDPTPDPMVTPTRNPEAPDWGLPWAQTPDEVGTVVVVWENKRERSVYYTDGSQAEYWEWGVRLVDFQTKAVVGDGYVSDDDRPWLPLFAALRARLFVAPFTAGRGEYLAPEWASQQPDDPRLLDDPGSHINGKLIMVSADTGEILRPIYSQLLRPRGYEPGEPIPPDWGLPWAATPDEVGTIVVVWAIQEQESAYYLDGGLPYREIFRVKLVDFETRTVVGDGIFYGDAASTTKTCSGDMIGPAPWAELMEDLRALPQR